jgi:hypothetical protein
MEIVLLKNQGVMVKSKSGSLGISARQKPEFNAILYLNDSPGSYVSEQTGVVIGAPGEYEVSGIKVRGVRVEDQTVYMLLVNNVEVLVGTLKSLERVHSKLQESMVVLVEADVVTDPSFLTALAEHVIVFFGEQAQELANKYLKDTVKTQAKIQIQKEKLPAELETVLLA